MTTLILSLLLSSSPVRAGEPLGARIMEIVERYPTGAAHPYLWVPGTHTDGTSRDLVFQGVELARNDGSPAVHCAGLTFEVWWQALEAAGPPGWLTPAQVLALKERWYVRDGGEQGMAAALVELGLGLAVLDWRELRPGDLIQFWRNSGKGHSAVFVQHRLDGSGAPRSMIYWSAQASSEGIGRRYVSVGTAEHQIDPQRLYAVRPIRP
jgi:hypothetical protein